MKRTLQRALSNGLPPMSLWNCHTPGVDSIVLESNPASTSSPKMVRMFVVWPGAHKLTQLRQLDDSFPLAVHNHRYDLWLRPVVGSFINYEIEVEDFGIRSGSDRPIFEFPFHSAIGGEMGLGEMVMKTITYENYRILYPSYEYFMQAEQLHTVVVPKSPDPVAWLVYEWADRIQPLLYSPTIHPDLSQEGLYERMDDSSARSIVKSILDLI